MAKETKLSEFEKGEISVMKRGRTSQREISKPQDEVKLLSAIT